MSTLLERLAQKRMRPSLCPDCDASVTADAMNISEGVALCPQCGSLFKLSELNASGLSAAEIIANPPVGCTLVREDQQIKLVCALRSFTGFFGVALFALFWNGIVSLFAIHALGGLYANLIGPLPKWFPAIGAKEGVPEMNGGPMDLGMTLFLCVFLTPFVMVGVGVATVALTILFGKTVVVISEFESYVATGIGWFRLKRRFDPLKVEHVRITSSAWKSQEDNRQCIELIADNTIKFGSMLNNNQRAWFRAQLKQLFFRPDLSSVSV